MRRPRSTLHQLAHRPAPIPAWALALALIGLAGLAALAAPAPARAATGGYDGYHDFAEVEQSLHAWEARPEVTLVEIGRSAGGRSIWVARIAGAGDVPPDSRPAVFVGANMAGFHNAGTEAALDLIRTLTSGGAGDLLATRTFYVAPVLDPDAHDALFAAVRARRAGNGQKVDHDRDGLVGEDGPDDLDGDGRITRMRIPDPTGRWLPDPADPRVMVKADPRKERVGAYRIVTEGRDDDGDGEYNEDPATGVVPDENFAHQFPYPQPEAGPWPSYAPESKAVMDFLLAHRNVALAVVYGPANNFLAKPQSLGGGGDLGTQKFDVPKEAAEFLGLDPEQQYTIDEVWDAAKDLPFIIQNGITKDQVAQFLGAGPATKVADDDMALIDDLAKEYSKRLEAAGLPKDRPAEQYGKGGFTPWLYYQYGVLAVELDVWGIPKAEAPKAEGEAEGEGAAAAAPLTLERLKGMSADQVIAQGEDAINAFLRANSVPAQFDAARVIAALQSGQVTPEQMVGMIEKMGGGGGGASGKDDDDPATKRRRDVLAWLDAHAPGSVAPWTPVTLPDGTKAEVGGLDPFAEVAPPYAILQPALAVHTATVLDLAAKLARVEILTLEAEPLGSGVVRVHAVAGNRGYLPTHTAMAERAKNHLPVRLELGTGDGVELVTGHKATSTERLEGSTGTLEGTWLVRATPGARIRVTVTSDDAGSDTKTVTVEKGA